jgi:thioredoxin 1
MASPNLLHLTDESFEKEALGPGVALVDFWAEWCMPCRMIAPTIEELADEYAGRVKVGKVDTDGCRDTSIKFGISAIPTILVFKDGKVIKKFVGLQQKKDFKAALDAALSP